MPVKSGRAVIPVHCVTRENNPFSFITMYHFSVVASTWAAEGTLAPHSDYSIIIVWVRAVWGNYFRLTLVVFQLNVSPTISAMANNFWSGLTISAKIALNQPRWVTVFLRITLSIFVILLTDYKLFRIKVVYHTLFLVYF